MILKKFNYRQTAQATFRHFRSSATNMNEPLMKTALFDLHHSLGGKMVPFAGYELPVQYAGMGVLKEHLHCREEGKASLFDVSHMGQIKWSGKDAVKFLEKVCVGDMQVLKPGDAKLSLIIKSDGGIMDDTVITNAGDFMYMVVNGACKYKDMDYFQKYIEEHKLEVHMNYEHDMHLLALQGDGAKTVLGNLAPSLNLKTMPFMHGVGGVTVAGIQNCRVTRCGYTGEDGFEIAVDAKNASALAASILAEPNAKPCGLGARDSLRLEAGLCLYGNDLDETINPAQASLMWTIGGPKSRRRIEQGFEGASTFLESSGKLKPVDKKRVGIAGMSAPARGHTEIYSVDKETKLGEITSGGFGPTFGKPIAMGYVTSEHAKEGTDVLLSVRGKFLPAKVTKMPFVRTNYFKPE